MVSWELLYGPGYSALLIGLFSRIAQRPARTGGLWIGIGVACFIPSLIAAGVKLFSLGKYLSLLFIGVFLLEILIVILGVFCILIAIPWPSWAPGLRAFDAFTPRIAAVLILWLPLQWVLLMFAAIVHDHKYALVMLDQGLLPIVASLGALLLASPVTTKR